MREAPNFWHKNSQDWRAKLFVPLSIIYSMITWLRQIFSFPYKSKLPVICVGNFTMGGAGKTPLTLSIFQQLTELDLNPCILSRGYGGEALGPLLVNKDTSLPPQVGDEPYMMAQYAPVVIAKKRKAGAQLIENLGYDCIIMDDGFQNPTIYKDLSICVVDAGSPIGNGCVFPAGPLREPLSRAKDKCDGVVYIGEEAIDIFDHSPRIPKFTTRIVPAKVNSVPAQVLAFAGIGRPEKFYNTLKSMNINVVAAHNFPDHHPYNVEDLECLKQRADSLNVEIVTTEKDWVKLPEEWQKTIYHVPISLDWDHIDEFKLLLQKGMTSK